MNFPERDLSNQFISRSYQDVVQQFLNTGSLLYLLDGYGNVIFQIPSASYGGIVLTQDQSASYALQALSASYAPGSPSISASYALSSSYALSASNARSSSYSITSTLADVATLAELALTASLAETASISVSASFAYTASYVNAAAFDNLALTFEFRFSTNTSAGDPGSGRFRYNSSTSGSISELYISDITNNGLDISTIIDSLKSGSYKLYVQQKSDATKASLFQLSSNVTDNTGWFTAPIQHISSAPGGLPDNNQTCVVFILNTNSVVPGQTYPVTASWAVNAQTASYVVGAPVIKSGRLLSSSFGAVDDTFTASVVFASPFPSDYAVTWGSTDARIFTIDDVTLNGFTLNANSNILFSGSVYWQAITYGEFNG